MAVMAALYVVLFAANLPQATPQSTNSFPIGDVRNCPVTQRWGNDAPLYRITALPGSGFDNLRNLDMGEVFFFNYSTCKISNDGKYLLPDSISLFPIIESKIDLYSEFFDHWDDYTSMTSSSINLEMGTFFSQIGGKFSAEYGTIKSRQVDGNAKTARALIKSRLYTVKLHPDSQLHPAFKSRLVAIANSLLNNDTASADYLSELLVRDYGTHYVTTLDAGGVLSQIDHLDSSYVNSQDTTKLAAAVGVDFFSKLSIGAGFSYAHVTTNQSNYQENRKSSQLITMGGPQYRGNFTLQYWEDGLPNALVATDRSGNPLHFCITPTALPDLPPTSVLQTANSVFNAINRYYKVNTRYGCTDPGSKNFNFQANVDDNSCGVKSTNFTFGGLYQTCVVLNGEIGAQCNGLSQVNPLTGNYSCPNGYTPVRLRSGITTGTRYVTVCNYVCESCGFLYLDECCDCHGVGMNVASTFQYQAYWCAALGPVSKSGGYLFGGVYTSTSPNPITGASRCPIYFTPLSMAQDISVCVSVDVEQGSKYSIPFAGFDSCEIGNPLAITGTNGYGMNPSDWPSHCPQGYTQHMVTVDNGCEINYCILAGALNGNGLLPPQLPPFSPVPQPKFNVTRTLVVGDYDGGIWVKGQDGTWSKSAQGGTGGLQKLANTNSCNSTSISTAPLPQDNVGSSSGMLEGVGKLSGAPSSSELSSGEVAAASVGSLVGAGTIIAMMILFGKLVYRRYTKPQSNRGEMHTQSVGDDNTAQYSRLVVNNRADTTNTA